MANIKHMRLDNEVKSCVLLNATNIEKLPKGRSIRVPCIMEYGFRIFYLESRYQYVGRTWPDTFRYLTDRFLEFYHEGSTVLPFYKSHKRWG